MPIKNDANETEMTMNGFKRPDAEKIAQIVKISERLIRLHECGALGGEIMPEDSNPGLPKDSESNFMFFTLPMALNYQRNSYHLWESAKNTYEDTDTADVFSPNIVVNMQTNELRDKLLKYKVALQPNKHPEIWMRLCQTFVSDFEGSVKNFLYQNALTVASIKAYMGANKKMFPYLSGTKIMNYWLYVISQYTEVVFADKENITVAPDTHVLQASVRLGLIEPDEMSNPNIREIVSDLWNIVFAETSLNPIDIHTPLWLWSRSGFIVDVMKDEYSK